MRRRGFSVGWGRVGAARLRPAAALVRLVVRVGLRWRGFSLGWSCAGAASRSGGAVPVRLLARVGLRRCGFDSSCAPKGPRPGGWERGGSGSRAAAREGPKDLRWRVPSVDVPSFQRSTGGRSTAERVRGGRGSPFSWTVPREGRSAAHPTPKGSHVSSFVRSRSNASAFTTGSRIKRRSLGVPAHERRSLRPTRLTARVPNPTLLPAARSRPFRKPHPAPAEAAHQQSTTPCGSAPARSRPPAAAHQQGHDPRRQRTSKVTTTATHAAAAPSPTPAPTTPPAA